MTSRWDFDDEKTLGRTWAPHLWIEPGTYSTAASIIVTAPPSCLKWHQTVEDYQVVEQQT